MGKPARPIVHARAFGAGGGKASPLGGHPAAPSPAGGGGKRIQAPRPDDEHNQPPSSKRPKQQQLQQQPPQQQPLAVTATPTWRASTVIDQQAARFLARLLDAARTRKGGATVKSLCLADGVAHKRATYAVTCETLKHLPALRAVIEREGLIERHAPKLGEALACVLAYEALLGQGLPGGNGAEQGAHDEEGCIHTTTTKSTKQQSRHCAGPAENAVRRALPGLRRALVDLQREAGASTALELASRLANGGADGGGSAAAAAAAATTAATATTATASPEQQQHWRCVRVNTLKLPTVERALAELGGSGSGSGSGSSGAGPLPASLLRQAKRDPLLPEVLLFPPGTDLHAHPFVRSGALVLQSRASCLPARALAPRPGWTVLDACAAPGNKTTHLAALVAGGGGGGGDAGGGGKKDSKKGTNNNKQHQGRVLAFDRDPRRLELLRRNVERAGAAAVVAAERADFLALDPSAPDFRSVRAVLLDPSCSGSGTAAARQLAGGGLLLPMGGGDQQEDEAEEEGGGAGGGAAAAASPDARLEQLARFQAAALKHALRFPACERVSYSTCSVHRRENEAVVAEVLLDAEVAAGGWRLADPFPRMGRGGGMGGTGGGEERDGGLEVAPMYGRRGWPHPGLPAGQERLLVRTDAARDGTDGFFVALFVRDPLAARKSK